jgi:hypothetical protein
MGEAYVSPKKNWNRKSFTQRAQRIQSVQRLTIILYVLCILSKDLRSRERANMVFFYRQVKKLIEAVYFLHKLQAAGKSKKLRPSKK